MQIDETALAAAIEASRALLPTSPVFRDGPVRDIIAAYLAALPKPEGIPVRIAVAVNAYGGWYVMSEWDAIEGRPAGTRAEPSQCRWINAVIPPYEPPPEHEVTGSVE